MGRKAGLLIKMFDRQTDRQTGRQTATDNFFGQKGRVAIESVEHKGIVVIQNVIDRNNKNCT